MAILCIKISEFQMISIQQTGVCFGNIFGNEDSQQQ